jgi:hypothetical protein
VASAGSTTVQQEGGWSFLVVSDYRLPGGFQPNVQLPILGAAGTGAADATVETIRANWTSSWSS